MTHETPLRSVGESTNRLGTYLILTLFSFPIVWALVWTATLLGGCLSSDARTPVPPLPPDLAPAPLVLPMVAKDDPVVASENSEGPEGAPGEVLAAQEILPTPAEMAVTAQSVSETGILTVSQRVVLYAVAQVPVEYIGILEVIGELESHHSPGAIGDSGASLGWFQINRFWFHEGEDPFDPLTNLKVALRIRALRGRWGGGGGWTAADLAGIE